MREGVRASLPQSDKMPTRL